MEEIKLNVTTDNNEIVVRYGEALEVLPKRNCEFSGLLQAPKEYIEKNYTRLGEGSVHGDAFILINKVQNLIQFKAYDSQPFGRISIIGNLRINEKLKVLGINQGSQFSKVEIQKMLRKNACLFKDIEVVRKLIKALDDLQLTTEETIKDTQDKRGNVDQAFKRTVRDAKGILPEKLELFCPIFEGFKEVPLNLEIEIELDGKMPVYSFYCLEYDMIIEKEKDAAFSQCLTEQMLNDFTVLTLS